MPPFCPSHTKDPSRIMSGIPETTDDQALLARLQEDVLKTCRFRSLVALWTLAAFYTCSPKEPAQSHLRMAGLKAIFEVPWLEEKLMTESCFSSLGRRAVPISSSSLHAPAQLQLRRMYL